VSGGLLPGLTALAVAGLLASEWRGFRPGVWVCKPLASTGFVAYAIACGALESSYGVAVAIALVLGWWGDVLLIPRDREPVFLAGVAAFGASHVAYLAAFAIRGVAWLPALATGAAAAALAVPVWRWLAPHVGELRPVVRGYVGIITAMLALAAGATASSGDGLIGAGALAFYLSDLSVARDRFVRPGFANGAWGLPLYFGAQLLLARSVASI